MALEGLVGEMGSPDSKISREHRDKINVDRFRCLSSHHGIVVDDNRKQHAVNESVRLSNHEKQKRRELLKWIGIHVRRQMDLPLLSPIDSTQSNMNVQFLFDHHEISESSMLRRLNWNVRNPRMPKKGTLLHQINTCRCSLRDSSLIEVPFVYKHPAIVYISS